MKDGDVIGFANAVLGEWESAMQRFFEKVDTKREHHGLSSEETARALDIGYGPDVADAWREWDADQFE